jgi:peptidoglycan/LPS O-acetylase OafA/YrhL
LAETRHRIIKFDAIRGIAALAVVLGHCLGALPAETRAAIPSWLQRWPLALAADGSDAVVIFFILSGYVLTPPFFGPRPPRYLSFLIKRFCRIYLPFAAVLACAVVAYSFLDLWRLPIDGNIRTSNPVLSAGAMAHTFLMTGAYLDYDPPMWSLVHELRISAIFPLIALVAGVRPPWLALLASILFSAAVSRLVHVPEAVLANLGETARWVWLFVLGAILAVHHDAIGTWFARLPLWVKIAGLVAALILLSHEHIYWEFSNFGAAGLFLIAIHSRRAARILEWRPVAYLGLISYSVYLVHAPLLIVLTRGLWGIVPYWACVAAVPFLTILLAALSYQLIERPAKELGSLLARRLEYPRGQAEVQTASINSP